MGQLCGSSQGDMTSVVSRTEIPSEDTPATKESCSKYFPTHMKGHEIDEAVYNKLV